MADTAVLDSKGADKLESLPETDTKNIVFEHKLPGVWGKVYETKSKEGKSIVFARFRRYRKSGDSYEDNLFINSMTECDNAIEVLYEVKQFMRKFYGERDRE